MSLPTSRSILFRAASKQGSFMLLLPVWRLNISSAAAKLLLQLWEETASQSSLKIAVMLAQKSSLLWFSHPQRFLKRVSLKNLQRLE